MDKDTEKKTLGDSSNNPILFNLCLTHKKQKNLRSLRGPVFVSMGPTGFEPVTRVCKEHVFAMLEGLITVIFFRKNKFRLKWVFISILIP